MESKAAIAARSDRMKELLKAERVPLLEFLRELGEFEARREYEAFGYPSIWEYGRKQLGLADGSIFRRKESAALLPLPIRFRLPSRRSATSFVLQSPRSSSRPSRGPRRSSAIPSPTATSKRS